MKRLVIALGGNALGSNPQEQLELVKHTAKTIDRKSTRLNSSHSDRSRMPSSA